MEEPVVERPEEDFECEEEGMILPINTEIDNKKRGRDHKKKDRGPKNLRKINPSKLVKTTDKFCCIYCKQSYPLSH